MPNAILFHKTNCSTSLGALKLLKNKGINPEIRLYLENPPTEAELTDLIAKLGITAFQLIRTKDKLFQEKFLGKKKSDKEWIKVICKNPILLERPIFVYGKKAILGRPSDRVLEII